MVTVSSSSKGHHHPSVWRRSNQLSWIKQPRLVLFFILIVLIFWTTIALFGGYGKEQQPPTYPSFVLSEYAGDPAGENAQTPQQQIYSFPSSSSSTDKAPQTINREWRPSHAWLLNCSRANAEGPSQLGPWNVTRSGVAIGDCIKFCRCPLEKTTKRGQRKTFHEWYGSLACRTPQGGRLLNPAVVGGNLTFVDEIHQQQAAADPSTFLKPEVDAIVIHLRLGDVVEKSKASVAEILIQGAGPGYNPTHFERALKSVGEILTVLQEDYNDPESLPFHRIHMVGGSHKAHFYQKSRVYAACLHQALETAGYVPTTMVLEGQDPDVDFYFASHASKLIVSAGSFSNLMGRLAEYRGGKVLGRSFGIDWN